MHPLLAKHLNDDDVIHIPRAIWTDLQSSLVDGAEMFKRTAIGLADRNARIAALEAQVSGLLTANPCPACRRRANRAN